MSPASEVRGPGRGNPYPPDARCGVDGCTTRPKAYGYCQVHAGRWLRTGDPLGRRIEDDRVRFELRVDRTGECHRWTGNLHHSGYGQFYMDGRWQRVHRVALILAGIDVPDHLTVDHVKARGCRFKDCVRIDHLEVVPGAVNTLRSDNPCAINARKTHCIRGHEFTPENTRVNRKGYRACRPCINEVNRRKRAAARV